MFQERYKSEPVENDEYFLTVLRYIHQNPVKAGLVKTVEKYSWSSYNDYINENYKITDIDFGLNILSDDRNSSIKMYDRFMREANDDKCLEIQETPQRMTDGDLILIFKRNIRFLQSKYKD